MSNTRRKPPTEEQKEAAEHRRAGMRELVRKVAKMSDQERAAIVDRVGAVVTCESRPLSLFNTVLVLTQKPGASIVGGFQQWKRAGRAVMKGEHGFGIYFPLSKGEAAEPKASDLEDGEPERLRFGMATVFDISQTQEEVTA